MYAHLSLEMLQSMVVFLLVFTIMKGSPMAELSVGVPNVDTLSRLRFIRFLNVRICRDNGTTVEPL